MADMDREAHILVVDDDEIEGDELRYLLESEGYEVEQATSGSEALGKIEEERFDLVMAEIPLPDMDALQVIRQIREADQDVVEIVMGRHLPSEAAVEAWRSNVSGYVARALDDPGEVLAAVASGLVDRDDRKTEDLDRHPAGKGSG